VSWKIPVNSCLIYCRRENPGRVGPVSQAQVRTIMAF